MKHDACPSRTVSDQCNSRRVSAEGLNILVNPVQGLGLVQQTPVPRTRFVPRAEET